jgi:hypothetical protein
MCKFWNILCLANHEKYWANNKGDNWVGKGETQIVCTPIVVYMLLWAHIRDQR